MRHERVGASAAERSLARALAASAAAAGLAVVVAEHRSRGWASATFVGARHGVVLRAPRTPTLGGWIAALPEATFPVRGHLVADLAIERIEDDGTAVAVTLAALTIEER